MSNNKHGQIIIYKTDDGKTSLEVNLLKETVWLSLNQLTNLFKRDKVWPNPRIVEWD